tara:strand:+ start:23 stop:439 length:417 start_codon:yes stop_codon:yes gene_type:complete
MTPTEIVESFYADVWNRRDYDQARRIIAPDFKFRGSLDDERAGVDGFIDYNRGVHKALGGYTCTIRDMVVSEDRIAAQMYFEGVHQDDFFGVPATGKTLHWMGAAFFDIRDGQIQSLWVLGDIDGLKRQLGLTETAWA